MEQEDLGATLPEAYATALRLRRAGESDAEIARALGIDEDAIPALLRLADAKVAEHRARGSATQT